MAILHDNDPRFQNLARKIGVFVIVALAGVAITIAAIGVRQGVFAPRTHIVFATGTGQGLGLGMPVTLSGFAIGKVSQLTLTEQATVEVTLEIRNSYMKWVRGDSRARLLRESLIGNVVIEIVPGTPQAAQLLEGEHIGFDSDVGMTEVLDKLYGDVAPLIQDLRRVARYLDDPQGDVKQALKHTNELMSNADKLVTSLQGTRERLDVLIASLQRELPPAIKSGRETAEGSKKVVDSLQRTWPISSNIKSPEAGMLPLDSSESRPLPANAK